MGEVQEFLEKSTIFNEHPVCFVGSEEIKTLSLKIIYLGLSICPFFHQLWEYRLLSKYKILLSLKYI